MPYIVSNGHFPTDKIEEVQNVYFEMLKKYPHDELFGEMVVSNYTRTKKGMKFMGIKEVKKGKFDDFVERTNKELAMFYDIPGFQSKTEIWSTM